jgi:hypothetical protein
MLNTLSSKCVCSKGQYVVTVWMLLFGPTRVASTDLYVRYTIFDVALVMSHRLNSVVHPGCDAVSSKACSKP